MRIVAFRAEDGRHLGVVDGDEVIDVTAADPSLPRGKVLMNAPETDGPFFKVPKVLGADEDSAG